MKIIILSHVFYEKYSGCREILDKEDRPYLCLTIKIDGVTYAVPFRHHINHKYAFFTLPPAGIDFTKAVIIESKDYIAPDTPRIDSKEWKIIKTNENKIFHEFKKYLNQYRRAKQHPDNPRSKNLLLYGTLQYFDFE